MSGWIRKTIGELCDQGGGKVKTGPFGSQLHQSDYSDVGTPVVMPTDIKDGGISEEKIARVGLGHVDRLVMHQLSKGDIVYGRRGDIGRQALVKEVEKGWLCGTGCLRITLGNTAVIPKYLHLYLKMPEIIGWIQNQAIGATMPNLNTSILRRVPVNFPALKTTQRKIVSLSFAYDDLIENNKRRIALLEMMAEEIYREWFVRFRFPGYQTAEFEKGIPKGWEMIKVENAFDYFGGGTPSKDNEAFWSDGTVNWYTPSDITGAEGLYLTESEDKPNDGGIARSSAKMFPAYSIMMTSRATIGAIGINRTTACTNQGFITCIPNQQYPLVYLYHWLKLSRNYFLSLCGGATFPELNKSTFKRIEILTPKQDIVDSFKTMVNPVFDQIESLMSVNENIKITKESLLPRLISGKLSVEN